MAETRTIHDPFENKTVEIRNDLLLRLRGRYAIGPTLPNGEPEFGWRQHEVPPIHKEAADEIETLRKYVGQLSAALGAASGYLQNAAIDLQTGAPKKTALRTIEGGLRVVRVALAEAAHALTNGER